MTIKRAMDSAGPAGIMDRPWTAFQAAHRRPTNPWTALQAEAFRTAHRALENPPGLPHRPQPPTTQ